MEGEFNSGATMVEGDSSQGEEQTQEGQENFSADPAKEGSSTKKQYKFKVDGKEEVLELDEKGVNERIQRGLGAEKRIQKVAQLEKELTAKVKALEERAAQDDELWKKDRRAALKARGFGRKEVEELLLEDLERESMDPAQRELQDLKRWKQETEEREQKTKADKEESEERARKTQLVASLKDRAARTITESLKDSKLPSNPRVVARMASYLQGQLRLKLQDSSSEINLTPEAIREAVSKDFHEDFKTLFSDATVESIIEVLGEEKLKQIREWDNKRVSNGFKPQQPKPGTNGRSPQAMMRKASKSLDQQNFEKYGTYYPHIKEKD